MNNQPDFNMQHVEDLKLNCLNQYKCVFIQVWQWIRHKATLEDTGAVVTMEMVHNIVQEVIGERFWSAQNSEQFSTNQDRDRLLTAARMFEEIVTKRNFPEFITTFLNMDHTFLEYQKK